MEQEKKQGSKELRKASKRKQEKARKSKRKQEKERERKRKQENARECKKKQEKARKQQKATESNSNPLCKEDGQSVVVAMVMGVEAISPEAPLYKGVWDTGGQHDNEEKKGKG